MIFSNFDKIETVDYDTHIRLRWLMYFYFFLGYTTIVCSRAIVRGHPITFSLSLILIFPFVFFIYLFIFFLLLLCVCIYAYEQDDADASFSQDSEDLTEKKKEKRDTIRHW